MSNCKASTLVTIDQGFPHRNNILELIFMPMNSVSTFLFFYQISPYPFS